MSRRPEHCPACGYVLWQPRIHKLHRLFFGMVTLAFENWPEKHWAEFKPTDREHLRAWLLRQAGHYDRVAEPYREGDSMPKSLGKFGEAVLLRMRANDTHFFFLDDSEPGLLVAHVPRSMAYDVLDEKGFAPVRDAVFQEIEIRLETKISLLIEEAKRISQRRKLRPVSPLSPREKAHG